MMETHSKAGVLQSVSGAADVPRKRTPALPPGPLLRETQNGDIVNCSRLIRGIAEVLDNSLLELCHLLPRAQRCLQAFARGFVVVLFTRGDVVPMS